MTGSAEIWTVILVLGIGTFLIRFSFIGLVGDRALPAWAMRLLRYVPVAVMPGAGGAAGGLAARRPAARPTRPG